MGFYVLVTKEVEEDDIVIYRFGPNENNYGYLQINKNDGKISEITSPKVPNSHHYLVRATIKLQQSVRKGEYPDKTSWES